MSEPKEEVFSDPLDPDGTNRTGVYLMRIKLKQEIPELIPLDGLRIKIIHHQVKKLCTRCFETHLRKDCEEEKKSWFDYVRKFMAENAEIDKEFYGGHYDRVLKDSQKSQAASRPAPEDYNLPKSRADLDKLLQRMKACGIDETKAMEIIKEKKVKYNKACALFDSKWKWKSQPWTYV